MNNNENEQVSSTSTDSPSNELQLPREPCSRDIVYKGRLTKTVDIVYTDLFLDVSNFERDKVMFIERVLDETFTTLTADAEGVEHGVTGRDVINTVVVCSKVLYNYIRGAQQEARRDRQADPNGLCQIPVSDGVNVFFCDVTMAQAPERIDRLVTFNVDPFEVCTAEGNKYLLENTSRLKRIIKHAMSADYDGKERKTRSGLITVRLVFSVFSLNERALETFSASNNVTVLVSDARFVLVDDNSDRNAAALEFVCNYCSDLMLCLNDDMRPFVVDGAMPFTVDSELISDPLNFIKLQTRADLLELSPQNEYFRFKQFYYTFVYGKQNKWGIEMVSGDDNDNNNSDDNDKASAQRLKFFDFLNDAMHAELTRLYKTLRKIATHNSYERLKRRTRYGNSTPVQIQTDNPLQPADEVETEELLNAREKLLKAYSACPLLMSGVDVRSITALGDDGASLKRDHRRLVASAIATGKRSSKPNGVKYEGMYAPNHLASIYDTMTYPHGGDLCDANVLNALLANEVAVSSCMVVQNRLAEPSNSRITYNRFFNDTLFADVVISEV